MDDDLICKRDVNRVCRYVTDYHWSVSDSVSVRVLNEAFEDYGSKYLEACLDRIVQKYEGIERHEGKYHIREDVRTGFLVDVDEEMITIDCYLGDINISVMQVPRLLSREAYSERYADQGWCCACVETNVHKLQFIQIRPSKYWTVCYQCKRELQQELNKIVREHPSLAVAGSL